MKMLRNISLPALPTLTLLILALLVLASPPATAQTSRSGVAQQAGENIPISRMSVEFLYLAASRAMEEENPALAIGFLKAIVEKDPKAVLPRLQLAELLLQIGRAAEAREPVQQLMSMSELPVEDRNTALMLQVQILILDDKPEQAIDNLQAILRDTPDAYPARLMLIRLLTAARRYADAHRAIHDGIKQGDHPQLYHIQAQLFIREGDLKKAEQSLNTLIQLEPDESGPVLMLSQLALRQGKPVKAENVLRHHLAAHPDALGVSNALGRLLVEQKRGSEAIAVYEDIAERTGGNADVLIALGLLHYQQEDFQKAAETFQRVLNEKDDARARFYYAASLEALGKADEAHSIYQHMKKNEENFAEAQLRMATLDLRAGRNDAALLTLRQLIRSEPKMAGAYTVLSAALMRQKAYKELLAETEPALSLDEVPVQLLFNRAAAFEGLKQYTEAAGQIRQLFNIEPDNIEALNFLGYLYAEQGVRLDEAEQLIRRALKEHPDNGYYLDSLAWVHYQRAEYDKALSVQRQAISHVPDDPVMHEHLGDILWKSGKTDEARSTWKDAIRLGHEDSRGMQNKIDKGM